MNFFQGYIYDLHSDSDADIGPASLDRLLERPAGSYGLIIDADSARCLMCEERDLVLIEDSSRSTTAQLALGYRKGFALKDRMDGLFLRYFADGLMDRLRQKWFKTCVPSGKTAGSRKQPSPFGKAILPTISSHDDMSLHDYGFQTAPSSTCSSPGSLPPSSPSSSCSTT